MSMITTDQQPPNKALHPTAYSFGFGRKLPSPTLPAAGELVVLLLARGFVESATFYGRNEIRSRGFTYFGKAVPLAKAKVIFVSFTLSRAKPLQNGLPYLIEYCFVGE